MSNFSEELSEDSSALGPGTDLVISLAAILLLTLAIQTVLKDEQAATLEQVNESLTKETRALEQDYDNLVNERQEARDLIRSQYQTIDHLEQTAARCVARIGSVDLVNERQEARDLIRSQYQTIDHLEQTVARCVARIGSVDLTAVHRNQELFVRRVSMEFPGSRLSEDLSKLDINGDGIFDLSFHRQLARQRVTFGSHLLFDPDDVALNREGARVIDRVGRAVLAFIPHLAEVHVEGHADIRPTRRHRTNLNLGAQRAITVFSRLRQVGMSPLDTVMSVSSYGEFMPVARFEALGTGLPSYSQNQLAGDNITDSLRRRNRRIEFLLVYARR